MRLPPPLRSQRHSAGSIDFVHKVDHADFAFRAGLEQNGAAAVAKENAGRAIGVVRHAGVGVGADDQDLGVGAAFNQLDAGLQCVDEARAASGDVKAPGALGAQLVLHQACRRGEHHVGRDGAEDDGLDVGGRDAARSQTFLCGLEADVAYAESLGEHVTLADAGAAHDPLVGGLNHFFKVLIGRAPGEERTCRAR